VAITVMLALVAGVVLALVHRDDATSDTPLASTESYPSTWNPRIEPYAKTAEDLRGLTFLHPVKVRFLSSKKFEKTVTSDEKELDREDRTEIRQFTGLLRAFGLITGDVDLFKSLNDFNGAATLAYYSFKDKSITIRGHRLTPAVRSTLVHELTHALQDQHFDVGDRTTKLRKESEDEDKATTSEASVLDAIIEGDAERVQTLYRDSLTPKQQAALDASQRVESADANPRLKHVPPVIVTMMTSSYTMGQALVQAVDADGGNDAVDELFRHTPTHESALLDPFRVLAGDTDAAEVKTPELRQGEKEFDSGEFGVFTLYVMLAERLPVQQALSAADGWGGDAYVAFEHGNRTCARVAYTGETPQDTSRMYSALKSWVAAEPGSTSTVERAGSVLTFESCDPGKKAQLQRDTSKQAIQLAATRTYLAIGLLRTGLPTDLSRCMAAGMVRSFPISQLVDPTFGADDPAVQARVRKIAAGCK
jgi:hypothetical protein